MTAILVGDYADIGHGGYVEFTYDTGSGDQTWKFGYLECSKEGEEVDDIETDHSATANRAKTSRPGKIEPGSIKIQVNFDPNLYSYFKAGQEGQLKITAPVKNGQTTGANLDGFAYVKSSSDIRPNRGKMVWDLVFKWKDIPIYTPGG